MNTEVLERMSDEELIDKIREDDKEALDFLLNKYKYLVMKQTRTLYLIGGDADDLIQEGMIGLYKAIRDFKGNEISRFSYFANICIASQLYNAIKASNRLKNFPLNSSIPFSATVYENSGENGTENVTYNEMISSDRLNPEKMFLDKENVKNLRYGVLKVLSKFETDVFNLYMDGISYTKIGEILGKEPKSIDNAIQRIKSKVSKLLKENE